MKLAVRKEEGSIPGGGFHYGLMPVRIEDPANGQHPEIWELMGHIIIDVSEEDGERLLKEAGAALRHQYEVAVHAERKLKEQPA